MQNNDLQDLLVREAIVTIAQVRLAVAVTCGTETTWLEHLLLSGQLDEEVLARCSSAAVRVPACDPQRLAQVPREVLALLPADLAAEHRMVPLWIEPDGDLRVAMLDPSDTGAVLEVEFFLGRRVLREVALATPLAWALSTYYDTCGALWPRAQAVDARPRLARGSVPPPVADELSYEVELGDDLDDLIVDGVVEVRVVQSAEVSSEIADAPTARIGERQGRR